MNCFGLFPADIFAVQTMLMLIILFSFTDGMRIQVISDMHLHEKLLTVEVEKTDTVKTLRTKILEELKGIIKNETGIPQEELSLRYSNELKELLKNQTDISSPEEQSRNYYKEGNGHILEDSKRLEEYGIKDVAETIYLELIQFGIFIEHKGTRHSFSVFADESVKSLKEKIKEKLGIPPEEQILTRQKDGHVLGVEEELSKMYYHNIVTGTCLSLKETINFGIFINYQGKKYSFSVLPNDFVKSLKEKIKEKLGIPPEKQILTRPDGHVLWEEFSQMHYHNIVRGTCLTLNEIKVHYNGNSFNIEVAKATETVKDLKKKAIKKINESIPKEENTQIKKLSLKDQQGKILEDNNKTIADYKIQGPLTVTDVIFKENIIENIGKKIANGISHHNAKH